MRIKSIVVLHAFNVSNSMCRCDLVESTSNSSRTGGEARAAVRALLEKRHAGERKLVEKLFRAHTAYLIALDERVRVHLNRRRTIVTVVDGSQKWTGLLHVLSHSYAHPLKTKSRATRFEWSPGQGATLITSQGATLFVLEKASGLRCDVSTQASESGFYLRLLFANRILSTAPDRLLQRLLHNRLLNSDEFF